MVNFNDLNKFYKNIEYVNSGVILSFKPEYCPVNYFDGYDYFFLSSFEYKNSEYNTEVDEETFLYLLCGIDFIKIMRSAKGKLKRFYNKYKNSHPVIYAEESYPDTLISYCGGVFECIVSAYIFTGVKFNNDGYHELLEKFNSFPKNKVKIFHQFKDDVLNSDGFRYEIAGNMLKITIKSIHKESSILFSF